MPLSRLPDPAAQEMARWPKRADGSQKGLGYFGLIGRPAGQYSSELSVGVNLGNREMEIPSIVPTLSHDELNHLIGGGEPTTAIMNKAVQYARLRMQQNKPVFATPQDSVYPIPSPPMQLDEILK